MANDSKPTLPRGQKFRREHPIPPYTIDFCCLALKLIVEVDGEHHQTDEGRQHDQCRDQYLAEQGYQVVRFRVMRSCGIRLPCGAESNRQSINVCRKLPLIPSPSPPLAKASSTRSRQWGRREPESNAGDHTECTKRKFFVLAVASANAS